MDTNTPEHLRLRMIPDGRFQVLLGKARKMSIAQFGLKEWSAILGHFNFKVSTRKEGRTVVGVTFATPTGQALTLSKEPQYRGIVYYEVPLWLKSIGFDLVAESSKALGLETPERERELKDLYERDLTATGSCSICGGNFKMEADGGLHHHGYTRPGDGQLHGTCLGVGFYPIEVSPEGLRVFVTEVLPRSIKNALRQAEALRQATEVMTFSFYSNAYKTIKQGEFDFERVRQSQVNEHVRQEVALRQLLESETKRLAAWAPARLPEQIHAGKFKKRDGA